MKDLKNIFKVIKPFINKYTIVIGIFTAIMLLGKYSLVKRIELSNSVSELENEKARLETSIKKAKHELELLNNNKYNLERLAREKYLMRKENEDIFLIEEDCDNSTDTSPYEEDQK